LSNSQAIAAPPLPGALGSPFVLPLACLAAAHGPGRPGLWRCRQGGLACPGRAIVSEGQEAGRAGCLKMLLFGNRDFSPTGGSGPGHCPRPAPRLSWSILLCGLVCRHLTKKGGCRSISGEG